MTREQAISRALALLEKQPITTEYTEIIGKLKEIKKDLYLKHWNKETILDRVDQFILEHNRLPRSKDFDLPTMPNRQIIKIYFDVRTKEFLDIYYPQKCDNSIYRDKTKEEWKEIFIETYNQINHKTQDGYNKLRNKNHPTWITIARMFGISRWYEWLEFCNVEINPSQKIEFKITRKSDIIDEIQQLK